MDNDYIYANGEKDVIRTLKEILERLKTQQIRGITVSIEYKDENNMENNIGCGLIFGEVASTLRLVSKLFQEQVKMLEREGLNEQQIVAALLEAQFSAAVIYGTDNSNFSPRKPEKSKASGFSKMSFTLQDVGL